MTSTRSTLSRLAGGFCAAGLALAAAPMAVAQDAKPWKLHDAIGAPDWLRLSGSLRPRYETLSNPFFAGRTGDDELFSVQSTLAAEAQAGDVVFGGEVYDSRILSENGGGGAAATSDALELLQAYVAWRPKDLLSPGDKTDLMAGRFTMDLGSRRLISRSGFQSQLQQFEGVRGSWTNAKGVQATAFWMSPLSRLPSDTPSALDNDIEDNFTPDDVTLSGLHLQAPVGDALGELYIIDLDETDEADLPSRNRDLTTWGVRARRAPKAGKLDFDIEWATQIGTTRATTSAADVTDLDQEASMTHLEAGYTFQTAWSPRLSLHYDHASGDKSPTDLGSERFDTLFGDRAFEFGPTAIYGFVFRSNLSSPGLRLELTPDKQQDIMAMVRWVNLDQPRDSFGNSGVRDASGLSGDEAGTQIELRYRRWLIRDSVRLQVGGAYVAFEDFFKLAPNAPKEGDPLYGYAMLTWTF